MTLLAIPYPEIDPVLFEIGPLAIRWYALSYIAGLILAWRYMRWATLRQPEGPNPVKIDDFLAWATIAVVLGGRLGYVLFYRAGYYLENPLAALEVWQGGMSFHGGFLGVVIAAILFCRKNKIDYLRLGDLLGVAAPIGLFFGRLANFVNGELYGRAADVSWAMVFPADPLQVPRHPSQLYEAALEGLVLFLVMHLLFSLTRLKDTPGALMGCFVMGYGLARITAEFFREPDAHLGFLIGPVTMGQILSVPMVLIGLAIFIWARKRA